jgi:hypothetical protein
MGEYRGSCCFCKNQLFASVFVVQMRHLLTVDLIIGGERRFRTKNFGSLEHSIPTTRSITRSLSPPSKQQHLSPSPSPSIHHTQCLYLPLPPSPSHPELIAPRREVVEEEDVLRPPAQHRRPPAQPNKPALHPASPLAPPSNKHLPRPPKQEPLSPRLLPPAKAAECSPTSFPRLPAWASDMPLVTV